MAEKTWNKNVRFNTNSESAMQAWSLLHSDEVKNGFKSQNEFIICAINDYYERYVQKKDDPYLETREKEDAFVERIVSQVTEKILTNLMLNHVSLPNAAETLWHCDGVTMDDVMAKGDYFAMNSQNMKINDFELAGNYSFDGARNIEIHNAKMLSKDAFWNSENVTVYDSYISGEYLGWNAKNLTLINCTIESLQGMCYIENLVMKNCKLLNTTLAFEYSTVDVEVHGRIESVLNPISGIIRADSIGEFIMEKDRVHAEDTQIVCQTIEKTSDKFQA